MTQLSKIQKRKLSNKIEQSAPINYHKTRGKLEATDDRIVKGYAIIWNDINEYQERLHRGCCAKSIESYGPESKSVFKIKFHDEHGRACGTLSKLEENDMGLYFETNPLDDVEWANNLLTQVRSGTLNNFSYGFDFVPDKMMWHENDKCFDIYEIRLFEISAVAIPAGLNTFAVRSKDDVGKAIRGFIKKLPKKYAYEARRMFALQKQALSLQEPPKRSKALNDNESRTNKRGIDYNYLFKNFKL